MALLVLLGVPSLQTWFWIPSHTLGRFVEAISRTPLTLDGRIWLSWWELFPLLPLVSCGKPVFDGLGNHSATIITLDIGTESEKVCFYHYLSYRRPQRWLLPWYSKYQHTMEMKQDFLGVSNIQDGWRSSDDKNTNRNIPTWEIDGDIQESTKILPIQKTCDACSGQSSVSR